MQFVPLCSCLFQGRLVKSTSEYRTNFHCLWKGKNRMYGVLGYKTSGLNGTQVGQYMLGDNECDRWNIGRFWKKNRVHNIKYWGQEVECRPRYRVWEPLFLHILFTLFWFARQRDQEAEWEGFTLVSDCFGGGDGGWWFERMIHFLFPLINKTFLHFLFQTGVMTAWLIYIFCGELVLM